MRAASTDSSTIVTSPREFGDDDTWQEAERVTTERDSEANEADLIEQATVVPDDDSEFDR